MCTVYPADPERCLPIRVVADADAVDGRLGGRAPAGILVPERLTYFLTIRLFVEPEQQLSLFVGDYEALAGARGRLNEPGLVGFVVHQPSPRRESTAHASSLSSHGLMILPEEADLLDDEDGGRVVRSDHKLGGRPHLIRESSELRRGIEKAAVEGFSYALQMDFPDSDDDTVSGPWPFGDGILGVFARSPFGAGDWRWWWDF